MPKNNHFYPNTYNLNTLYKLYVLTLKGLVNIFRKFHHKSVNKEPGRTTRRTGRQKNQSTENCCQFFLKKIKDFVKKTKNV